MTNTAPHPIPALEFENLGKVFTGKDGQITRALDGVSLTLRPGGITALVGPDGAGKTTLLRIAAGLLAPSEGRAAFFGEARPDLGRIGYMPQKFGLYEDLSVQENLDLYADLRGLEAEERAGRYADLLAMTGLEKFTARLAGHLSGGMKQKLGLICTLLKAPDLLLLDEPTVGVDPLSRRELREIISALTSRSNTAVLVSTAYLDEAARCEEILLLFEGKPLARKGPETLKTMADGMAFMATPENEPPRLLQTRLLTAPGVIDAVPQGGLVRLVHDTLDAADGAELKKRLRGASVAPAAPALEDSFMLLLRKNKRPEQPPDNTAAPGESFPGQPGGANGNGNGQPVIETRNVTKKFGAFTAVSNVSFSVYRGEVFGLLGPNGAGKTTTFRMLCGLLPATEGTLHVAGVDVRKARSDARRRIGYVAQKFSLYGLLTVMENLEFFAGAYGLRGAFKDERIRAVIRDFSLAGYEDAPADSLPGGNRQRLAMAAGLLHQPQILFLDEPTSGADPLARREFWQRISILAESGVTVVVTTHFMEEAEYCDRILIQDSGVMLALDTPANIRKQARSETMEDAFIRIVEDARKSQAGEGLPEE